MRELVLQIRRGGTLLGSWPLSGAPLELRLVDPQTGQEVAAFTARGAAPTGAEEEDTLLQQRSPTSVPLRSQRIRRLRGDDLTMPVPDEEPETVEATSPPGLPVSALRAEGDDLTMPLPDAATGEVLRGVRPAEVWRRWRQSWTAAGWLPPGHQVAAHGARARLTEAGELLVWCGTTLQGTATLPDGSTRALPPGDKAVRLPPGASVMLRHGEQGLYVRTELREDSDSSSGGGSRAPV